MTRDSEACAAKVTRAQQVLIDPSARWNAVAILASRT